MYGSAGHWDSCSRQSSPEDKGVVKELHTGRKRRSLADTGSRILTGAVSVLEPGRLRFSLQTEHAADPPPTALQDAGSLDQECLSGSPFCPTPYPCFSFLCCSQAWSLLPRSHRVNGVSGDWCFGDVVQERS